MDMEFMDHYHRPYPGGVDIRQQPSQQQPQRPVFQNQAQHGQLQGQQPYPFWNHQLVAFYRQHQRAALMGQGAMHGSKQTEPKPRLAKDEVELLEREFAKNQKPNSTTKRELAERMGVEVPRINNWFQNRRAKEKQLKKTAEFEAQQANQGDSPESSSPSDHDQGVVSEFFGLSNQHHRLGLSTATFDEPDRSSDDSDDTDSEAQRVATGETQDSSSAEPLPVQQTTQSPASSDSDGFIQVQYEDANPALQYENGGHELGPSPSIVANPFMSPQHVGDFHPPMQFPLSFGDPLMSHGLSMHELPIHQLDSLPTHETMLHDPEVANLFRNGDYFAVPAAPQFPSQLIGEGVINSSIETSIREEPVETPVKMESLSPSSMSASSPAPIDMRFKSPPPPANIASRRNKHRRPAPLGIPSLRGAPHMAGPKTGIDVPRRNETASPMRRISSATGGLTGRIQKPFINTGGPRSPFLIERNKEALFQQLQLQSPIMGTRGNAMSPETPEGMNNQCLRENTATSASDDDQNYGFGSLHTIGVFPIYKAEPSIKTPPDTPGLAANFPENFFPNSIEQAWSYVPHDEPLPTPSLCSHGGSELEFSMAPQMPGYVASQPATPSFPSIGPTYGGFFGGNLANAEYNFPDSYPPECSARSSPAGPLKSKQFQFAQNVTPQDFNQEK